MAFKLHATINDKIDKICNKFFWSGDLKKRKITLVSWKFVCMEKEQEGLGLRKMKHVGQALRGKLVW